MRRFEDQVVVVTGASRGIGRAIAVAFGREGARVVVNYRTDETGAQETGRRIMAAGGVATLVQADVSVAGDVARLVDHTEQAQGPIEVLVNNAGVVARKGFLQTTEADFDWQFATNVKGLFLMSHAVASRMALRRRGSIVNVSSVDGAVAEENRAIYGASKGAVSMLTRGMALDLVSDGIRVNAIAPGVISMDIPDADRYPSFAASLDGWMPMKRLGRPEDCAGAVLFLCSEEASYITGHVLAVDGGLGIRQPLPFPS
ncbi:MAG TPA: glucose 1-dehydrogenase [Candidatus Methylomirabilis sp.]|nr:glucose 1-dehydrogenase [Candidatus Methylomirabilis sp.]